MKIVFDTFFDIFSISILNFFEYLWVCICRKCLLHNTTPLANDNADHPAAGFSPSAHTPTFSVVNVLGCLHPLSLAGEALCIGVFYFESLPSCGTMCRMNQAEDVNSNNYSFPFWLQTSPDGPSLSRMSRGHQSARPQNNRDELAWRNPD